MLTKKREYLNTDAWHQFFILSVFTGMTKHLSGFVIPAEAGIQRFRFVPFGFPFAQK
jgi:hypothetical protein